MRRIARWYRKLRLFSLIVWRVDWSESRMSVATAWDIAGIIHPRSDDFDNRIYGRSE